MLLVASPLIPSPPPHSQSRKPSTALARLLTSVMDSYTHAHPSSFPQLVRGPQANVIIPALPTLPGYTPRSWNLSADGSLVVVGFLDGALQVQCIYMYTYLCVSVGVYKILGLFLLRMTEWWHSRVNLRCMYMPNHIYNSDPLHEADMLQPFADLPAF